MSREASGPMWRQFSKAAGEKCETNSCPEASASSSEISDMENLSSYSPSRLMPRKVALNISS